MDINKDILRGRWKQIRGRVRQWRAKLTHDSIDGIAGHFEEQVGRIQEGYGRTRIHVRPRVNASGTRSKPSK